MISIAQFNGSGAFIGAMQWDTVTFTRTDATGAVVETRPVTADEQAAATVQAQNDNASTLRTAAGNALANNRTYLGIASPTNAQVVAQVQALTRQMNGIIRLVIGQLDGTN